MGREKLQRGSFVGPGTVNLALKLPLSRAKSWTHRLSGSSCLKLSEKIQMSDRLPFPNNQPLLILRTKHKRKTLFRNPWLLWALLRQTRKCSQGCKYLEASTNINFLLLHCFIFLYLPRNPMPWKIPRHDLRECYSGHCLARDRVFRSGFWLPWNCFITSKVRLL